MISLTQRVCTWACGPCRNHVSEGVWVKINFWNSSHPWENLLHICLSCQVTHSLLKNNKMQGELNTFPSCHIISNSFSIPSSELTKRWHSPSERLHHRNSSLTAWNSTDSVTERCCLFLTHTTSVKVPEFSSHVNLSVLTHFYRRGSPMEVIDDCTVFFFGILPHTSPPTGKSSSPSSHFTSNRHKKDYQVLPPKVGCVSSIFLLFLWHSLSSVMWISISFLP
jgi:hypothetical protein